MPAAARLTDTAKADACAHCCPACASHQPIGPAILGSPTVFINHLPAFRETDMGIHAVCCGSNMWTAKKGSGTVNINSKAAMRKDDMTTHCAGSPGKIQMGSADVNIGG